MPPRYVLNSPTRQTIDTTLNFDASISAPPGFVTTLGLYNALADIAAGTTYDPATKTIACSINGAIPAIGGASVTVGDRVALLFTNANKTSGGIYSVVSVGGLLKKWSMVRASDFNSTQAIAMASRSWIVNGVGAQLLNKTLYLTNNAQIVLDSTDIGFNYGGGITGQSTAVSVVIDTNGASGTADVTATVLDDQGNAIVGAYVQFSLHSGSVMSTATGGQTVSSVLDFNDQKSLLVLGYTDGSGHCLTTVTGIASAAFSVVAIVLTPQPSAAIGTSTFAP